MIEIECPWCQEPVAVDPPDLHAEFCAGAVRGLQRRRGDRGPGRQEAGASGVRAARVGQGQTTVMLAAPPLTATVTRSVAVP